MQKNCEIQGAQRTIFMKKKNDDYLDAQEQGKIIIIIIKYLYSAYTFQC